MAFMAIDITGAVMAERGVRKWVEAVPVMAARLPTHFAGPVADIAVKATKSNSPVDTGALADETGWRDAQSGIFSGLLGERKIEIVSMAANKSGRFYALFRAYGFNTRSGYFWTPPESPVYPEQAAEDVKGQLPSLFRMTPDIMRVQPIAG